MTQEQLQEVMKYHLGSFNDEKVEISDDTIHGDVLSHTDGIRSVGNSADIYPGMVKWSLAREKKKAGEKPKLKKWPGDWMSQSVKDLAAKILVALLLFISVQAKSQVEVNIGAAKTALRDNAITIGLHYLKSFDSVWRNSELFLAGKNSFFTISPQVDIETGNQDAFSSISLKATGMLATFKTKMLNGIEIVESRQTFHVFPISFGAETNNLFNNINGLLEVGWMPYYQNNASELWKRTRIAFFVQAGYKFKNDTTGSTAEGGEIDQSLEEPNQFLGRFKGSASIDTKEIISINSLNIGIVGSGDVWYDFVNSAIYHRIDVKGRFYISRDQFIDLVYQHGSGAPLFNQGDQYGLALTLRF
jgi:hypothetical protein